jgi:hypothetical protein
MGSHARGLLLHYLMVHDIVHTDFFCKSFFGHVSHRGASPRVRVKGGAQVVGLSGCIWGYDAGACSCVVTLVGDEIHK